MSATFPCCAHPNRELAAFVSENGEKQFAYYCPECDTPVKVIGQGGLWIKREALEAAGVHVAGLTVVSDHRRWRTCFRCGRPALCELHHCACVEWFGEEADEWPIVWACNGCHNAYHEKFGRTIRRPSA